MLDENVSAAAGGGGRKMKRKAPPMNSSGSVGGGGGNHDSSLTTGDDPNNMEYGMGGGERGGLAIHDGNDSIANINHELNFHSTSLNATAAAVVAAAAVTTHFTPPKFSLSSNMNTTATAAYS